MAPSGVGSATAPSVTRRCSLVFDTDSRSSRFAVGQKSKTEKKRPDLAIRSCDNSTQSNKVTGESGRTSPAMNPSGRCKGCARRTSPGRCR